jgi:hypothetical protein
MIQWKHSEGTRDIFDRFLPPHFRSYCFFMLNVYYPPPSHLDATESSRDSISSTFFKGVQDLARNNFFLYWILVGSHILFMNQILMLHFHMWLFSCNINFLRTKSILDSILVILTEHIVGTLHTVDKIKSSFLLPNFGERGIYIFDFQSELFILCTFVI